MRFLIFFVLFAFSSVTVSAQFPAGFAAISIAQNLDPTVMTLAPGGDIFLCEKSGQVRIIRNGQLLLQPLVEIAVDNYNERGLSGIAVHPNYPTEPYIYLYFTVPNLNHNRVIRMNVVNDQAVPGSELVLLDIDPMPGTIHNGGAMVFGNDGKLYIAVGDGAGFGVAQSLTSLLGKVLRINPDGTIPADNPYFGQTTGQYRSIWALGFRNPFTFTLQAGTGAMAIGDVGSDKFEEVNIVEKGRNYGWPLGEGFWQGGNPPAQYKDPLHAYNHAVGCCVTGAAFYNPDNNSFPANYAGRLFFGEYCQGKIWHIDPITGGAPVEFATGLNRPLALLTHPDGSLYCITRGGIGGGSMIDNTSSNGGVLWRIIYNPSGAPLVAIQPNDQFLSAGETARFGVKGAGNPTLQYQWARNNSDIPGANSDSLIIANVMVSDSGDVFTCRISNGAGAVWSGQAHLWVTTNQRPIADIVTPSLGALYKAGQVISFQGAANDPETGALPAQNLTWRVDFHHNTHVHPAVPYTSGISQGNFTIPQIGETSDDVWYRIHLYAQDNAGLSTHIWRDVKPLKSQMTFQTSPQPFPMTLDGQPINSPTNITSVVGIIRTVAAPYFAYQNNLPYRFNGWSDGEPTEAREIETPENNLVLTAHYDALPVGTGTGLLGLYFNMDNGNFLQPITTWRIDPQLNYYWDQGSPFPPQIGNDNFAVRWLGEIEPWLTGTYYFYLTGDDGVRLFIDDQNLIDSWVPSDGEVRTSEPIYLEAGKKYKIKVEFFEIAGEAEIKLEWGIGTTGRTIVPSSQLYPADYFVVTPAVTVMGDLQCRIVPNPFRNGGVLELFSPFYLPLDVAVYDMAGRLLSTQEIYADKGFSNYGLQLEQAPPGIYFVKLTTNKGNLVMKVEKM